MLHLDPKHLNIVKTILKTHVPDREVVAFGSRTTDSYKPHSDLDLCVMGDEPVSFGLFAKLREAFSESDLPMRVDLVDWASMTSEFRVLIQNDFISIETQ